jgi:NOL1/NOP2/fmu family ribosome biogenesis protein
LTKAARYGIFITVSHSTKYRVSIDIAFAMINEEGTYVNERVIE